MVDVAEARGLAIDAAVLSERLGVPVVPVTATQSASVVPVISALETVLDQPTHNKQPELPAPLATEAARLSDEGGSALCTAEASRALLYVDGVAERRFLATGGKRDALAAARQRLHAAGIENPMPEVQARYRWLGQVLDGVVRRPEHPIPNVVRSG